MIYIIFGASGSGKTTLLISIKEHLGEKAINRKATTRNIRTYDDMEVISYPSGIPRDRYDYFYSQYGYEYAIEKKQLQDAVDGDYHHFVICNDIPTIEKIKSDFKFNVKLVYISFDAPEETIREIQRRRGITDDEINLRISKIKYLRQIFNDNQDLFDAVIMNKYGETPETSLWPQVESIIGGKQSTNFEVARQIIDYLVDLVEKKENINYDYELIEKGFLFIIMAMKQNDKNLSDNDKAKNTELFNIQTSIKAAAQDSHMRAELADSSYNGNKMILTKITENIKKAEIIIADLTYERPNCYFELGFAMANKKNIIITAKSETTIHFDVSGYDIIYYDTAEELYKELKRRLLEEKISNN